MWNNLCRNGTLALVVLIGSAGWSQAQSYPSRWGQNPSLTLQGAWFSNGDPLRPCHIDVAPGGFRTANLIFMDEVGNRANGRLLERGVVVTDNGFMGRVSGDVVYWSDGSYWTR